MKRVKLGQAEIIIAVFSLVLIFVMGCEPYAKGNKDLRDGNYAEAAAYFEGKLKSKPDDPVLNNQLAYSYAKIGKFDLAVKSYQKALQLKPDYPEAHYNLGYLYMNRPFMQLQDAIKEFDQAIKLKPDYAKAYNNRGLTYVYAGRFDLAQKDLEKAISLDAQNQTYRNNLDYCKQMAELGQAVTSPKQETKTEPPAASQPPEKKP